MAAPWSKPNMLCAQQHQDCDLYCSGRRGSLVTAQCQVGGLLLQEAQGILSSRLHVL
ncbi:hypothetical protein BAUCODRAFT_35306 [Baudoinia panamericana UAMH 10762]|uniref:Uncharacterized protein n=1 Tax=Baudoinia panamericana (strain UAMH 10762) TaxID=717646 RepID=M2MUR9_BAUPA|nr:uncharacterized protein BAUCODRAFT_35306 [Baudoinia panamericana UAMH 10762]EMC95323.1 hypothetical protein BAUCODRAFT_35306 [Baudoinia panamericana UAMH 10762]